MSVILKPGQKKKSYEILRELVRGGFTVCYEAKTPLGERIFLKQYKSPTKRLSWYQGFVDHQNELKRRIESSQGAKDRCYRFVEFFEDGDYFQAFEFVDQGMALAGCLKERDSFAWKQFVVFARVMMSGIRALHGVNVVHCDLKPENIILLPDPKIELAYQLRVIDLDGAILSDRQAPWHGHDGYKGTDYYLSPEHIAGKVPMPASDVFTCGIMLGQILGQGNPFPCSDPDVYRAAVKVGRYSPIRLRQEVEKVNTDALEAVLNACLEHDPAKRPTAVEVFDALVGRTPASIAPLPSRPKPPPVKTAEKIEIRFGGKHVTTVGVDGEFGSKHFRQHHDEAKYLDNPQFKLFKRDGGWWIDHIKTARWETLVNGRRLEKAEPVCDGMRVEVGDSAKEIALFPLELKVLS